MITKNKYLTAILILTFLVMTSGVMAQENVTQDNLTQNNTTREYEPHDFAGIITFDELVVRPENQTTNETQNQTVNETANDTLTDLPAPATNITIVHLDEVGDFIKETYESINKTLLIIIGAVLLLILILIIFFRAYGGMPWTNDMKRARRLHGRGTKAHRKGKEAKAKKLFSRAERIREKHV